MAGSVIGQIALELNVNTKEFKEQLQNISKTSKESTGKLSGMLSKFAKFSVVAMAAKAIVGFSKECLQLGSDLAEVQNVVDVTFGNMSNDVNNWAKNAMTSFGLSEKVAKEYVGQLGAMSKAFGNSTQEAYTQATELAGLVGDVASFYNLSTDEAFTKLKAVYTGETESLKSLGVVMTQTALDEYAMAKGFGKTTKSMTEQEKVALRLAFVQDRLSDASGDFARTSDGWANQTRVLALRFDAIKASIGQGLINALLPVVRVLNTILERLQVVADAFSDFMEGLFGDAGSKSSGIGAAASAAGDIASGLGEAESSAAAIKKSLAGFDQINVIPSSSGSSTDTGTSTGGSTSGITETIEPEINEAAGAAGKLKGFLEDVKTKLVEIVNITGLKGLWDDIVESAKNLKDTVMNLFSAISGAIEECKPNIASLGESFQGAFVTKLQTITKILGDVFKSVTETLAEFTEENEAEIEESFANIITLTTDFYNSFFGIIEDFYASLGSWWDSNGKRIFDEIGDTLKDLGAWILEIWNNWITPIIQNFQAAIDELWNQHLKPLWDEILMLITSIWNHLKTLWDGIKPIVDWLIDVLGPILVPLINGFVNKVANFVGMIIDYIRSITIILRGLIDFFTGVFRGDWDKAWEGILTIASGVFEKIKTVVNGIIDHFKIKFETIIGIVDGVWQGIQTTFPGIVPFFNNLLNQVKNFFSTAWASILTYVKNAYNGIISTFSGIGTWFGNVLTTTMTKFSDMWSKVKSGASDAWSSIKNTFSPVPTWFKDKFTAAWNNVKNVFSTGGKIFSGIKDGIADAFKTIVNKLIDGINKVIATPFEKINSILRTIRNFKILGGQPFKDLGSISVPKIPKLATGGYVAANTPQLAIIGDNKREGEIVAPESKITEAVVAAFRQFLPLFGNGGNNKPIYLTIKLGDGTFWEGFVDYHNDIVKRTGDTPLLI